MNNLHANKCIESTNNLILQRFFIVKEEKEKKRQNKNKLMDLSLRLLSITEGKPW